MKLQDCKEIILLKLVNLPARGYHLNRWQLLIQLVKLEMKVLELRNYCMCV